MAKLLPSFWLALLLLATTPVFAGRPGSGEPQRRLVPAPDAPARTETFVRMCAGQLRLTPPQTQRLRTYLRQQVRQLDLLALMQPELTPEEAAAPTATQQLDAFAGQVLTPAQLPAFRQVCATPAAVACLKAMAFVP